MRDPISGELTQGQVYRPKKRVENYYVLNKAEHPRTVTVVQSLLLNYQHNYNYNINYQSNGVRNQLMFLKSGKTGDNKGDRNRRSIDPGEIWTKSLATTVEQKGHYDGNNDCPTQARIK